MDVKPINRTTAKRVVESKHYRRTLGIMWEAFGLYKDDSLVGVVCYGQPSPSIQQYAFPDRNFRLYELTRLVVDDGIRNGASTLIGRSLGMLREQPCAVISYADSAQGHVGIVYQATNWMYTGAVKAHDKMYKVDGEVLHSTTVCDRFGTTKPTQWARENGIETIPPQPKHRYFKFIGTKRERKTMRAKLKYAEVSPYPKTDKTRYLSAGTCETAAHGITFSR